MFPTSDASESIHSLNPNSYPVVHSDGMASSGLMTSLHRIDQLAAPVIDDLPLSKSTVLKNFGDRTYPLLPFNHIEDSDLTQQESDRLDGLTGHSVEESQLVGVVDSSPQLQTKQDINSLNPLDVVSDPLADQSLLQPDQLVKASEVSYLNDDEITVQQSALSWNPIDWFGDIWDGISTVGKELLGGAKWLFAKTGATYDWAFGTLGNGLRWSLNQVGLDPVGNFLDKQVFDRIGDKLQGIVLREIQWIEQLPDRVERFGSNFFNDFWNDGGFWSGLGKWLGKNALNLAEIAGYSESLETLFDVLKFNSRSLTAREIEVARSVFGDSIDYDQVRIDQWSFSIPILNGVGLRNSEPFTTFHTINAWGEMDDATLIHELTHVWQYENMGAKYIPEALSGQQEEHRIPGTYPPDIAQPGQPGYDYGGATELQNRMNVGQGITSFNPEQQAKIVEHYFEIREDGRSSNDTFLPIYAHFVDEVSSVPTHDLINGRLVKVSVNRVKGDFDGWWNDSDFYTRIISGGKEWTSGTKDGTNDYRPGDWNSLKFVSGTDIPITIKLYDSDPGSDDHIDINPNRGARDLNFNYNIASGQLTGDITGSLNQEIYARGGGDSSQGEIWFMVQPGATLE
jgi:hypothetical protein